MKMKFSFLAVGTLLFWSAPSGAEGLSALFKIGQPVWRFFSTPAAGYGALGEDRSHAAVYVSSSESRRVRAGAAAEVRLGTPEGLVETAAGRVTSVLADADPRTGQAIIEIEIPLQHLPERTYAAAAIETNARRVLAEPAGALLLIDGRSFVFKQKSENDFEKTSIEIGDQSSG